MADTKPNFAADLGAIQSTVDLDVAKILSLAKPSQPTASVATTTPEPSDDVSMVPKADNRSKPEQANKRSSRRTSAASISSTAEPQPLENVTTRLSRATNELLTEAALRQKLAKRKPDTRQDMIETALREWFQHNGYLKNRKSEADEVDQIPKSADQDQDEIV